MDGFGLDLMMFGDFVKHFRRHNDKTEWGEVENISTV